MRIDVSDNNIRIDKYLASNTDLSRSKIQKLIEKEKVLVNNLIVNNSYKVSIGDVVEILNYEEQRRSAYAAAKKQSASDTPKTVAEQKNNFVQRRYDEDYLNSFIVSEEDTQ